jgi:hypothetical protein
MISIAVAVCALVCTTNQPAGAGTIFKLSLGGDPDADIEYSGGVLSTVNDGIGATTGEQNTAIEFLDFLENVETDILTSTASFTLNGLAAAGSATVLGGNFLVQDFTGGTLEIYDESNTLLLSGSLTTSSLAGPLGPPATGGIFTTSIATVTGGSLAPYILEDSLTMSISLASINGNAGLSFTPAIPALPPPILSRTLNPFTADASVIIDGEVPEPAALAIAAIAGGIAMAIVRRRRTATA